MFTNRNDRLAKKIQFIEAKHFRRFFLKSVLVIISRNFTSIVFFHYKFKRLLATNFLSIRQNYLIRVWQHYEKVLKMAGKGCTFIDRELLRPLSKRF
jgi:hypothetical protein